MKQYIKIGHIILFVGLIGIFAVKAACSDNANKGLSFTKEKVNLSISKNSVVIKGTYWFKNHGGNRFYEIIYPFHIDYYMSSPTNIEIFIDGVGANYKRVDEGAIVFPVHMDRKSQKKVTIQFRQALHFKKVCKLTYITVSTQTWNSPLKTADFRIQCDKDLLLQDVSMPYKKIKEENKTIMYRVFQESFFPKDNLEVLLKKRRRNEN